MCHRFKEKTHTPSPGLRKHLFFSFSFSLSLSFFFFLVFLGPQPRHVEGPRLGVQSELQLLAYTTAAATQDPNCVCDLRHSSRQRPIPHSLREARDGTHILMDASQIHFR